MRTLAKSNPPMTLDEHTNMVIKCLNSLMDCYGDHFTEKEKELCQFACQYHDYGKLNTIFQDKIMGNKEKEDIHHGYLSPFALPMEELKKHFSDPELKVLITAILFHHTKEHNLPQAGPLRQYCRDYFDEPLETYLQRKIELSSYLKYLLFDEKCINVWNIPEEEWNRYQLVLGILKKCDQAASAGTAEIERKPANYLEEAVLEKYQDNLTDAQIFMKEHQEENVILVAPTGSGKTEASFLWMGKDKSFYTLPLRVASNAMYDRMHGTYHYSDTTILHSDAFQIMMEEDDFQHTLEKYDASKRLSYPVTVCTVDQLFKFPYKAFGLEPLYATLCYSKVIIDEIQMYSANVLACLILGLKAITEKGGKFAITTATLPPVVENLIKKYVKVDYVKKVCISENDQKRHQYDIKKADFEYDKILSDGKTKKVLVICNTVKKAQEVYCQLKKQDLSIVKGLLHARFIKKDRASLEAEIKKFADGNENGIWISTQIVEASLDIDFDTLYTELSPIDSLFQRLGRCYRKREYREKVPNIHICYSGNSAPYEEELCEMTYQELQPYQNQLLTEIDKQEMIAHIYQEDRIKETKYYRGIVKYLNHLSTIAPASYTKREADSKFRDIYTSLIIPEPVYLDNYEFINDLIDHMKQCKKEEYIRYKQMLLNYTLSVPTYYLRKQNITKSILPKLEIYRMPSKYSSELGYEEEPIKEGVLC